MYPVDQVPSGIRVVRRGGGAHPSGYRENARQPAGEVEVRARIIGARGFILMGITVIWLALLGSIVVLTDHIPALALLHFLAGVVLLYASVRQLQNGFHFKIDANGIVLRQRTSSGMREERVRFEDLTGIFCESGTIELGTSNGTPILRAVHHVSASLADGRNLRLLVEIERPDVAFFVAQLLGREAGVPTR